MILIIEWSAVPVDVHMDVLDVHVVADDTCETELQVASLGEWLRRVRGLLVIEGEDSCFIVTLGVGYHTRIIGDVNQGSLSSQHALKDVVVGKTSLVEHWESLHVSGFSFS